MQFVASTVGASHCGGSDTVLSQAQYVKVLLPQRTNDELCQQAGFQRRLQLSRFGQDPPFGGRNHRVLHGIHALQHMDHLPGQVGRLRSGLQIEV